MAITDERIRAVLDGRDVDALVALIDDPQVSEDQRPDVVSRVLYQLEELFYEGLPDLVMRICVEAPEKIAFDPRHFFLKSWLKREGYHHRPALITNLISRLRQSVGEQLVAAIRTAWVIGYRDDVLQAELVRIAGLQDEPHSDNEAEGYALAALAGMSYADFDAITRALQSRLDRNGHLTEPDFSTAMSAATVDMIPALVDAAASQWGPVHALLELASRYPDRATTVWKAYQSLNEQTQFLFAGNVADRVDLREVADYLISEALSAFREHKQRNILPPADRLLKANLPSQMRVFLDANESLSSEQRGWLKSVAIEPTGNDSSFQTHESLNKEAAWKVILRLGLEEARDWLPPAMSGELHHTLVELAGIAGFLGVTEAVKPLADFVKQETPNIAVGIGCLRQLGILGTREALDALLESRVRVKQGEEDLIPRALVKAITSACMTLQSCEVVWNLLLNRHADSQIREACSYVIENLSRFSASPLPEVREIVDLLRTEKSALPGFYQLVLSLSRSKDDPAALKFLRELGGSNDDPPELTQALALKGLLNEFPARIEKIGLKRTDEGWGVAERLDDTAAFALLFLYRADPSFEPAVRQVLSDDLRHPAIQITANLRSTDRLSEGLRQALWDHALRWNSTAFTDRSALEAVARTFPEKLMEDSTIIEVSQWGSSARRAYLASLRVTLEEHGHASAIAQIACQFLVDEESSIRRDAAWLARDSDPIALRQAVDRLATKADELDHAVFMLDAAFWLETDWSFYLERGRSHREPLVRELAQRLSQERKAIDLARKYLAILLESREYLHTWCHGQALLELGNEETIHYLRVGLPSEVYRRAYLIWLTKELEKRVEKRRRDQSEKVDLPPPVGYEQTVEVIIELEGERLGPFVGVLQESQARRAHGWLWSWSVRIENEADLATRLVGRDADDAIPIETSNGRRGKVLPVRAHASIGRPRDSYVLLLGHGELSEV